MNPHFAGEAATSGHTIESTNSQATNRDVAIWKLPVLAGSCAVICFPDFTEVSLQITLFGHAAWAR